MMLYLFSLALTLPLDATEEEQSNDVSSSHPDYLTDGNREDKCNEEEDLSNETKM